MPRLHSILLLFKLSSQDEPSRDKTCRARQRRSSNGLTKGQEQLSFWSEGTIGLIALSQARGTGAEAGLEHSIPSVLSQPTLSIGRPTSRPCRVDETYVPYRTRSLSRSCPISATGSHPHSFSLVGQCRRASPLYAPSHDKEGRLLEFGWNVSFFGHGIETLLSWILSETSSKYRQLDPSVINKEHCLRSSEGLPVLPSPPGLVHPMYQSPFDNRFDHSDEAIHQIDWVSLRPWLASHPLLSVYTSLVTTHNQGQFPHSISAYDVHSPHLFPCPACFFAFIA